MEDDLQEAIILDPELFIRVQNVKNWTINLASDPHSLL